MKIIAVNIAFRDELFYKRWRLLSQMYDEVEVTLIGPRYYEYNQFGPTMEFKPNPINEKKFKVQHIDMKNRKIFLNDWFSKEYFKILWQEKPDFVYLIGCEINNVVLMTELYRKIFAPKLKIALFSMMGLDMPMFDKISSFHAKILYKFKWTFNRKVFDFVNVHYPQGKNIIKYQGQYKCPIYLQTQIGVNQEIYYPDDEKRDEIRKKYNIRKNDWVFSSAIRIEEAKGVFDILVACSQIKKPFKYLLMGNGADFEKVKSIIKELGLENRIILTDRIPNGEQVAAYMNASDCFIHVPKTKENWVDTFPLAVVQAMACRLPVIGSDSGAVPYQVGQDGIIVKEGNINELATMMIKTIEQKTWAKEVGEKMLQRVLQCFEIRHLNNCLYQTIKAHLENTPLKSINDQVTSEFN